MNLPDLILMDLRMPELDGYEAAKILKLNMNTKNIPIIAVSASLKNREEEQALKPLFANYLLKPIDISELVEVIKKNLKYKTREPADQAEETAKRIIDFTGDQLQQLPAIIKILESEFLPLCNEVMEEQRMDRIDQFGKELATFGEKNSLKIIADYGKKILSYSGTFKIAKVMATLKGLPVFIEELKSAASVEK
jgi:two-component system sensor histidine kinase EvgS